MLGWETKLPGVLILEKPLEEEPTINDYAIKLKEIIMDAGDILRPQQQQIEIRQEESEEPSLYMVGEKVWLNSYNQKKGVNPTVSTFGRTCRTDRTNRTSLLCPHGHCEGNSALTYSDR